jgi:uncharacterized protein (TIGR04222 family)
VRLIHHGALALDAVELRLTRKAEKVPEQAHPLEKDVYQAVDREIGSLLTRVRQNTAASADKLRERLEKLGLIVPESKAILVRMAPVSLLIAMALFGLAKIFVGVDRDRPVGFLFALVGITILVTVVFGCLPCFRSRLGDATLDKLKHDNAALEYTAGRRSHALTDDDLIMATGLFGVGVLAGGHLGYLPTPMRAVPPARTATGTSSCSSWFSCGSSSSCGGGGGGCGGGCGGGGCGGCGG